VLAERLPVIRSDDHEGVFKQAPVRENCEQVAEPVVEVGDAGFVGRQQFGLLGCAVGRICPVAIDPVEGLGIGEPGAPRCRREVGHVRVVIVQEREEGLVRPALHPAQELVVDHVRSLAAEQLVHAQAAAEGLDDGARQP
jgi:hypothetical protein